MTVTAGRPSPRLTRPQHILVGLVVAGAVVIAGIGFAGSYAAVRELALEKGFGNFAYVFPVGIDAGICVLLALDLLLTWIRIPFPLLRQTAWLLTAATIAFNGAAAWPDPLGTGMHAVIPILFVVAVEAARHAIGRIADITADKHMEGVRLTRWLLSPLPTFLLWRRMKLWELRSYDAVIKLEQERLVYQARLRSRFGRAWRRKAPVESLTPLRLARYGVPLAETALAGLAAAGIEPQLLPPAPSPAETWEMIPAGAAASAEGDPDRNQEQPLIMAGLEPVPVNGATDQHRVVRHTGHGAATPPSQPPATSPPPARLDRDMGRPRPARLPAQRPQQTPPTAAGLNGRPQPATRHAAPVSAEHRHALTARSSTHDTPHLPRQARVEVPTPDNGAAHPSADAPHHPTDASSTTAADETGGMADGTPPKLTLPDRYFLAYRDYVTTHATEPKGATAYEELAHHLAANGIHSTAGQHVSPATLRRYAIEQRIYRRWAEQRERLGRPPTTAEVLDRLAQDDVRAANKRPTAADVERAETLASGFERRYQALLAFRP